MQSNNTVNKRQPLRDFRLRSLADSVATDNESGNENEYITVNRKKRKAEDNAQLGNGSGIPEVRPKRKPPAKGTSNKGGLSGGEDYFDVFVYHVQKGQGCDAVKKFMEDEGIEVLKITKVSHDEANFESFSVNVKRSNYDKLCGEGAAEFWPANIRCRPYNKPRRNDTGGTLNATNNNNKK